jgi:GT2 family glycosyltransferase
MIVAAVVVTYNRKELLLKNLKALLQQSYQPGKIFVIDNACTDGTKNYLEHHGLFLHSQIEYVRLEENTGGAGGFSEGIKRAYEAGADWIWGMDDDAFPQDNALETLVQKCHHDPQACYWSNCDRDQTGFFHGIKIVDSWMFVGFFLNRDVIRNVGYPRKDFFIYHDDFEYAKRIISHGYAIKKVQDSLVEHDGGAIQTQNWSRKILKWTVTFPQLPDWKVYYLTRNRILSFSFSEIGKYRSYIGVIRKIAWPLLLTNPRQLPMFIKGYVHGIIGKSGKVILPSS